MAQTKDTDEILSQMLEQRQHLAKEVAAAQSRLDKMDAAIATWAEANGLPVPRSDLHVWARYRTEAVSEQFEGLTLPAAVKRVLEIVPLKQAKTASEILAVLERHNASPVSKDHLHSVQTALVRRQRSDGDILHTAGGRWGLRSWYTDQEIAEFEAEQDGANARDRQLHVERMKAGIERVKATGAHYGAKPRITPTQWERAIELVKAGETNIAELHREMIKLTPANERPMVAQTVRRVKDDLLAMRPYPKRWENYFRAHPPAPPECDDNASNIRAVK